MCCSVRIQMAGPEQSLKCAEFVRNPKLFWSSFESVDGVEGSLRGILYQSKVLFARKLLGKFLSVGENNFPQWVRSLPSQNSIEEVNLRKCYTCLSQWINLHLRRVRGNMLSEFN